MAQTNEVEIEGSYPTSIIITAVLEESMPYVEFSLGDERLRLHYDFEPKDVIKVDFEKEKVYINNELQMETIDLLYADFFKLKHGVNEIKTIPTMQLTVDYREGWL